jgi:hypothetical protein
MRSQRALLGLSGAVVAASDGYLYFTVNQLNGMASFNNGQDARVRPFKIYRTPIDGKPVKLTK